MPAGWQGVLLEHLLFHEIKSHVEYSGTKGSLGYWGTPGRNEVDFVYRGATMILETVLVAPSGAAAAITDFMPVCQHARLRGPRGAGLARAPHRGGPRSRRAGGRRRADDRLRPAEQYQLLRLLPQIARTDRGEPVARLESLVQINLERKSGGETLVVLRGMQPVGFQLRRTARILAGERFRPQTASCVVGRKVAERFKDTEVGRKLAFGPRAPLVLSTALGVRGGLLPALQASRLPILDALRKV